MATATGNILDRPEGQTKAPAEKLGLSAACQRTPILIQREWGLLRFAGTKSRKTQEGKELSSSKLPAF
jgi:hypothetical protein